MTKRLLPFFALVLFIASCGGDSENTIPVATCANATDFTISQQSENLHIEITTAHTALFYQVSVTTPNSNNNPSNGNIVTITNVSADISAQSLSLNPGETYLVYVRSFCDANSSSAWTAAKTFQFADFCEAPTNLGFSLFNNGFGFVWNPTDAATSYYQVDFGPQGFTHGSGTVQTTNSTYFVPSMAANTTYDFYIRSYCTASTGWSAWSGPYTYFSEYSQNQCTQPSNLHYTQEGSNAANFTWDNNGESQFEYALLSGSQNINNASLYTIGITSTPTFTGISTSIVYTFYVRAVCANGNRTAWTTILVDL